MRGCAYQICHRERDGKGAGGEARRGWVRSDGLARAEAGLRLTTWLQSTNSWDFVGVGRRCPARAAEFRREHTRLSTVSQAACRMYR